MFIILVYSFITRLRGVVREARRCTRGACARSTRTSRRAVKATALDELRAAIGQLCATEGSNIEQLGNLAQETPTPHARQHGDGKLGGEGFL
jgi:hypothetical protein